MVKTLFFLILFWAFNLGSNAWSYPRSHEPVNALPTQENGDLYWRLGKFSRAISAWTKEALVYQNTQEKELEIQTRLKIAQGHINLGKYEIATLELKKALALNPNNIQNQAKIWKRMGHAHNGLGSYDLAISNYQKSLAYTKSLQTTNSLVEVLFKKEKYIRFTAQQARGVNIADGANQDRIRANAVRVQAEKFALDALLMSKREEELSVVRALINWSSLSNKNLTQKQLQRGKTILSALPDSRNLAFTMLNWANVDSERQLFWLQQALNVADVLDDYYLKSYVLLGLGNYHFEADNQVLAFSYSQKSQLAAQSEFAHDSLFQAQKLSGDIYLQQGNLDAALDAYESAIASLDSLRQDSAILDIEKRISFDTAIEPIYRSALKLILQDAKTSQSDLRKAISIFDKLRLAQLQNYFGDNCFQIQTNSNSDLETEEKANQAKSATITSIMMDDKVIFLLELDNGRIVKSETKITASEIKDLAEKFANQLTDRTTFEFRESSTLFYDMIVKPFESELEKINPQILIFVHDGLLRNLPMAALFDGDRYLAQKWASISSLGLNLTSIEAESRGETAAAAFGLQTDVDGWSNLPEVASEIANVTEIVGGDDFLDEEFTVSNLSQQLKDKEYSIIHFSTHGYFGGTAENSFLLAYDQEISALELEEILRQSKRIPNLLVLSACETALSNESSMLGLAGIAARSGVKTTFGSLWQVQDDEQSEMIKSYYRHLKNPEYDKATALQRVQIEQIEKFVNAHPEKWASMVLIGSFR